MKRALILTACLCLIFHGFTQDINITFTATGEATSIDSVTALNQRTNQSVTLPGNETLVLRHSSGIHNIMDLEEQINVYPNPFSGDSRVLVSVIKPQKVDLRIHNISGQVVLQTKEYLQAGVNDFEISLRDNGFYFLVVETEDGYNSSKIVNLSTKGQENKIQYTGTTGDFDDQEVSIGKKSEGSAYYLDFSDGDNMHFACYSGVMTTIFTSSSGSSKNYDVEFAQCTDPDGKNYDVVIIGDQIWMEDNLAYLPSISSSNEVYDTIPHYSVYDYEGESVVEAKATKSIEEYGVIYNWPAAKISCPEGWHLPNDDEWTILTDFLILNGYGYSGNRVAIGKSIASDNGWAESNLLGEIGNDQTSNNYSGFNAIPAPIRNRGGTIGSPGYGTGFWSLTEYGSSYAYCLILHYDESGVIRGWNPRSIGFSVRCLKIN